MTELTKTLARFGASTPTIPDAARQMMRLSLMDWIACGMAGRDEPVSRIVREMVLAEGGAGQSTLFGGGQAPMRAAALVNGATSHALDYDDTHFVHIGHPSVALLPAALAVAEKIKSTPQTFLDAALIGCEASVRIGLWLGRTHYQAGFHQTATAGAFGAAIAAGRLLGLDARQLTHALGVTATRAAGLKSQFGTMGKPYNAGIAASSGLEAACLAQAGFQSNPSGIEGAQGFGPTHHAEMESGALSEIGHDWLFEAVSHKFHACCHGTHAMIEALLAIPHSQRSEVAAITVETHPRWLSVCNQTTPTTGLGVKFSYTHIAALVLAGHDTAALDTFSDTNAADPELHELREKVEVIGTDGVGEMQARVSVRLHNGSAQTFSHDLAAPMGLESRRERLLAKARSLIGSKAEDLAECCLDTGPDPQKIARLMAG